MYNIDTKTRIHAVEDYLKNSTSLKRTAVKFNIHYQSLFKWVKLYKKEGETRLLSTYKRPWNRSKKPIEDEIVLLKEKDPTLTVRKAKEQLAQKGIEISIKGIWGIWKRYGYAGFRRERLCPDFTEYCSWTKEAERKFDQANELFKRGNQKMSAEILNTVPMLPKNELLVKIPDSLLNLKRRVEKMALSYRTTPIRSYFATIGSLYKECKQKNLNYLALRVKIFEVGALSFTGEPAKQLKSTEELKKSLKRKGDYFSPLLFPLNFPILVSEGIARAQLSEIKKASEISRHCCVLIKRRKYISDSFIYDLGSLCTWTENFKKAEYCFLRVLDEAEEEQKQAHKRNLGFLYFHKGDYKRAISILKNVKMRGWGYDSKVLMCDAMYSLVKGMPDEAIALSSRALSISKKNELNIGIITAYSRIASAYCSLGKRTKALAILRRILPFAKRNFKRIADIFEYIVSPTTWPKLKKVSADNLLPTVKLIHLLKTGHYIEAFSSAQRKYLMTHFHQYIVFFPETVIKLLEKGKPTHLPRSMLKLPIFNEKVPVYNIKFLGPLVVYKNDQYLRIKLSPKDTAFLIYLVMRAGEPGKRIILKNLYDNFWKNSSRPSRNLAHLLVKIRKKLRIPPHLLTITARKDEAILNNRGIHFMTDYDEFKQILVTAQAFERAGEWNLARKELLRAFVLFRDEPFVKMYDEWSENMRVVALNELEKNATHFIESCFKQNNINDARRVIARFAKMMPHLDERNSRVKDQQKSLNQKKKIDDKIAGELLKS